MTSYDYPTIVNHLDAMSEAFDQDELELAEEAACSDEDWADYMASLA